MKDCTYEYDTVPSSAPPNVCFKSVYRVCRRDVWVYFKSLQPIVVVAGFTLPLLLPGCVRAGCMGMCGEVLTQLTRSWVFQHGTIN